MSGILDCVATSESVIILAWPGSSKHDRLNDRFPASCPGVSWPAGPPQLDCNCLVTVVCKTEDARVSWLRLILYIYFFKIGSKRGAPNYAASSSAEAPHASQLYGEVAVAVEVPGAGVPVAASNSSSKSSSRHSRHSSSKQQQQVASEARAGAGASSR